MGAKTKKVGGSRGGEQFSNSFVDALSGLMYGSATGRGRVGGSGYAGQSAVDQAGGVFGTLQSILGPGAGEIGGALAKTLESDIATGRDTLRARFGAGGGQAFGTPGAYAEAKYNATVAPEVTKAIGGLQLQALGPVLQAMFGTYGHETPGAQIVQQPGLAGEIAGTIGQLAPVAADIFAPGLGRSVARGRAGTLDENALGNTSEGSYG